MASKNEEHKDESAADEGEAPSSARQTHPAYALVSLQRKTGGNRTLFGSSLPDHHQSIVLRVHRATIEHSQHRNWYSWASMSPIIEVEMSPAQFAELITSVNMGEGVPATLRSLQGEDTPPLPETDAIEAEKVRKSFVEKLSVFEKRLGKKIKEAVSLLEGSAPIKVADRKNLISMLQGVKQEVSSNMPFAVESFQEAAAKVTSAAKAEIDAFWTSTVTKMGLDALNRGELPTAVVPTSPQLPSSTDSKELSP